MGVTSDSSGDARSARGTYSAPLALGRRTSRLCFTGARAARLATLPNATSRKYTVPASLISFMRVHASHTQPPYSHDTLQMRSLRVTTYSMRSGVPGAVRRDTNTRSKNLPAPAAGARAATLHAFRSKLGSRRGLGGERAERGRLCNLPCALALSARPCSHPCFPPCGDTFHNHDANTKTLR